MGLNMNYTLLMEGANKQFELPEYKSVYVYPCYEQSYILECINDMRRDMINNNYELLFIFENVESLNEGEIIDAIFGTVISSFFLLATLRPRKPSIIFKSIVSTLSFKL